MKNRAVTENLVPILKIFPWLVLAGIAAHLLRNDIYRVIHANTDAKQLNVAYYAGLIGLLGYLSYSLARGTSIPSFVTALLTGIAAQPLLQPIADHHDVLGEIVSIAAALILFQGGLETDFRNFRRLIWKIALLAFPGVLLTAVLMSAAISVSSAVIGTAVSSTVAVLLGAILASTDPASVIPLFQGLEFKESATKDIIVSESAMNDVVGAILTLSLVGFVTTSGAFSGIFNGYSHLFELGNVTVLSKELGFGVLAGAVGFAFLHLFSRHTKSHGVESGAHAIAFLAIILLTFYIAVVLEGSGYLAAFMAGLVFQVAEHLQSTEHFFGGVIEGIAKPSIFLLLGALVDLPSLLRYAPIGILVGVVFMLIIRPIAVFLMIGFFARFGRERLSINQLLFISFIRETGAIPAVLLVTVSNLNIPGTASLVPIGMWVILLTLILEPVSTPFVARRLGLVKA